jgi:hypothetical protein
MAAVLMLQVFDREGTMVYSKFYPGIASLSGIKHGLLTTSMLRDLAETQAKLATVPTEDAAAALARKALYMKAVSAIAKYEGKDAQFVLTEYY